MFEVRNNGVEEFSFGTWMVVEDEAAGRIEMQPSHVEEGELQEQLGGDALWRRNTAVFDHSCHCRVFEYEANN